MPEAEKTETFVFRLRVGEYPTGGMTETEDDAEWICLPTDVGIAKDMAAKHHEPYIESCVCYEFESSIPQITSEMFGGMLDFEKLNNLAWQYSLLSPSEQVKCKAALEAEQPKDIAGALNIAKNLSQYEFYSVPETSDQFFKVYLNHHMDTRFDREWLNTLFTQNEGAKLLGRLGASITDYGVISARGRSLFELVPYDGQQTKELTMQSLTDEKLEVVEVLGQTALFTNARLTDEDIPQGLYCYHLRHSDDGDRFCSIEPKVGVNHGGSVITKEPIDFGKQGYISFTEDTEPNFTGEKQTLGESLKSDTPQESEDKGVQMGMGGI